MADEHRDARAARHGIEPEAVFSQMQVDQPPTPQELDRSRTISAKRTADALERIAEAVEDLAKIAAQAAPRG